MKKLMMLVCVAMAAVAANAATANWKVTGGNLFDGTGKSVKFTGTAYVFDNAVLTQSSLFTAYMKDKSYDFAANSAAQLAVSSGSFVTTSGANQFSYGDTSVSSYEYYFVVLNGDNIYFSNLSGSKATLAPPTAQSISLSSQNNGSSTFSDTVPGKGGVFAGSGHWSSTSVPEPTSGLMILIGVGLMALKRKRA